MLLCSSLHSPDLFDNPITRIRLVIEEFQSRVEKLTTTEGPIDDEIRFLSIVSSIRRYNCKAKNKANTRWTPPPYPIDLGFFFDLTIDQAYVYQRIEPYINRESLRYTSASQGFHVCTHIYI